MALNGIPFKVIAIVGLELGEIVKLKIALVNMGLV